MAKNYYEILEIHRSSNQEDIANAYRRLSLKYHPKRNNTKDQAINNYYFDEVSEAYQVLSNPNLRGVYDVHGYDGLKHGITDEKGKLVGGFRYGGNLSFDLKLSYEVFEKFFATSNPFSMIKDYDKIEDEYGSLFGSAFGGMNQKPQEPLKDIEVFLECTLVEIYLGGVKKLIYKRTAVNNDGRTTYIKEEEKNVEIERGIDSKVPLIFKGFGNEAPGLINSDLIVRIKEKNYRNFARKGDDLIYTHKLTLVEALNADPISLVTLDGRKVKVSIDEIISPQTVKIVKGEGMPLYDKDSFLRSGNEVKKGNLLIKFDIRFPTSIKPENKEEIIEILNEFN